MDAPYDVRDRHMDTIMARELFDTICGDWLGGGISRSVYVYDPNPAYVVKFEVKSQSFQNAAEWDLWTMSNANSRRWLAQCRLISPCGTILIQRRAEEIPKSFRWPARIPAWLSDYKPENYGLVDGKLVCFDYGTNEAIYESVRRHKSRTVSTKTLRQQVEPYLR